MTDIFTPYETALKELLERLGKEHPRAAEARVLQARLLENIEQARRYGDNETRRSERAQILERLDRPASEAIGVSFNDTAFPDEPAVEVGERVEQALPPVLGQVEQALPSVLEQVQPFEPEMVLIPAGDFLMGSDPEEDEGAYGDEQPQHRLYLPDYYLSRTPVTNAQYAAFVQSAGRKVSRHWEGGKLPPGKWDHPVVCVSWHDVVVYCRWLAEVTGRPYTLPSEAEWEKGARGAGGRIYPWGDRFDKTRCNTYEAGIGGTTPVGKYSPRGDSPYGLTDMAGNVWEWTRSLFNLYPYDPNDGREDLGAEDRQLLRGGSWLAYRRRARCASRSRLHLVYWGDLFGFRVGLSPAFLSSES